jgi:hypothetical protein
MSAARGIHVLHTPSGLQTVIPTPHIEQFELIGVCGTELRVFNVDSSYPIAPLLERRD